MEASGLVRDFHASFLSLGTNLGDREANLRRALVLLFQSKEVVAVKISSIYQTAPQNFTAQDDFLNCVCEVRTKFSPVQLLNFCKSIEENLGRRETFKYGPRAMDVDILLYDDLSLTTAELTIPHPELAHRNFVLTPLHEIAPSLVIRGKPIAHWIDSCRDQRVELYAVKLA